MERLVRLAVGATEVRWEAIELLFEAKDSKVQ